MESIRFGVDGWNARYDEGFTAESVARIADAAACAFLRGHGVGASVVVGYDMRSEGRHMAQLASRVMAARGLSVRLSGIACPLPAFSWYVNRDPAVVGGLVLTAGSATPDHNGVRVRMADGGPCTEEFASLLESSIPAEAPADSGAYEDVDIMTPYVESLVSFVDADAISRAGLSVVHDPMYGTSNGWLANALSRMGAAVTDVHAERDEGFGGIRPEPVESWLGDCRRAVLEAGTCAGLANDANALRAGAIDERGVYVSPYKIAALLLDLLVGYRRQSGRVVFTTTGSMLVRRQAARLNCPLTAIPVGARWAYAEMQKGDVLLAIDDSGAIALPAHLAGYDGLLVDLLLCELMARSGKSLGTLVDELEDRVGHMDYGQRDIQLDAASIQMFRNMLPGLNPQMIAGMRPVDVDHADGLRLGFADGAWLLVRSEGADQTVHVYAEASTILERDALLDEGCALARGELS